MYFEALELTICFSLDTSHGPVEISNVSIVGPAHHQYFDLK